MKCVDVNNHIDAMLDGALDHEAEFQFKAHLSVCPECTSKYDQFQGLRSLLQRVVISRPPEPLKRRIMSSFEKKHVSNRAVRTNRRAFWLPLNISQPAFAMSLVAVILAALFGAFVLGRVTAPQVVLSLPQTSTISSATVPASKSNDPTVASVEPGRLPTVRGRRRSRQLIHRRANVQVVASKGTQQPLESLTTVSSSGTNYLTMASLDGFEPLKDTKMRIVKGEEQR